MAGVKTLLSSAIVAIVLAASTIMPVLAWHPKGAIIKKVQNVTTGSALVDANAASSAVSVKPGDTIRYVVEVRNDGAPASNGHNDMAKTIMTDTLPAGVEPTPPTLRTITENIGLLKPGQKVTKEYLLKVTSQKNGEIITNKACFTGDSTANDSPQKGCDNAVIKVNVPVVPPAPEEPEVPETPEIPTPEQPAPQPEVPAELPATGLETILGATTGIGALTYAGYNYIRSRRLLR